MTNNKDKKTEVTTFDVQVAEFIRNHKKQGSAADDEINDQLVIPFTLDADGIDDLLQRIQDAGISIVDKEGNIGVLVGKLSFTDEQIRENMKTIYDLILRARPAAVKGIYMKNLVLSTTMGPGIKLDTTTI